MFDPPQSPSQIIAGRYRLMERIGAGAFAVTYKALDTRLQRTVALKVLRTELAADTQFIARFAREAQAAAAISSEHTVQIFDFGQTGESSYIAMEFVDGGSLRDVFNRRDGRLPVNESVSTLQQVLRGLGAIHQGGVIHRDLKPENVLVGTDNIVRIADFGIASVADQIGLTTTGTTFGTAAYMAPEQGRGDKVSPATDLYAAGVMFFEMLTGRLPFPATTVVAMLLAHQNDTPPSLSSAAPELKDVRLFDLIIAQALAKDPARRFQSARSMSASLTQSTDGPIEFAAPTTRIERTIPIPVQPRPRVESRPVRPPQPPPRRTNWLGILLLLALLAGVGAAGAYYLPDMLDDSQSSLNDPATATPDKTDNVDAPAEIAPTVTRQPAIVPIATATESGALPATEVIGEIATSTDIPDPTATDEPVLIDSTSSPGDEPTEPAGIDPVLTPPPDDAFGQPTEFGGNSDD